jgi:hypothetical protein
MNSFWTRICLVPGSAWVVGCTLSVLLVAPMLLGPMRLDSEMRNWPLIAKVGLVAVVPVVLISYSLLVGFIYADAKRRHMRYVMWAWLALVPYFIGVILYFILRDPLPSTCPQCSRDVPRAFAYCPGCGASVHPVCSQCGKSLQLDWGHCPHCGSPVALPAAPGAS